MGFIYEEASKTDSYTINFLCIPTSLGYSDAWAETHSMPTFQPWFLKEKN